MCCRAVATVPFKEDAESQRTCDKCNKTLGSLGAWKYHTSNNVCKPKPPEQPAEGVTATAAAAAAVEEEASPKRPGGKDKGKAASRSTSRKPSAKAAAAAGKAGGEDSNSGGDAAGGGTGGRGRSSKKEAKPAASGKKKDKEGGSGSRDEGNGEEGDNKSQVRRERARGVELVLSLPALLLPECRISYHDYHRRTLALNFSALGGCGLCAVLCGCFFFKA